MTINARALIIAFSVGSLLAACGKNPGGGGNYNNNENQGDCPEFTEPQGAACVPIFDDCPAANEIPVLGGGCHTVGVTGCVLGTGCGTGFADDGAGGCDPVVPTTACSDGELAVLGSETCEAIRDCGAAPWGNVQTGVDTIYVDANNGAANPDGSAGNPYPTLAQALGDVSSGGQIVMAAGSYQESNTLDLAGVEISGRCPALVTLEGVNVNGQDRAPFTVAPTAGGARLEGVRLTGAGPGLVLNEAADVQVREVEINTTGGYGLLMQRGATASLHRVRITAATTGGIIMYGGALSIRESVVQDTNAAPDGSFGRGIDAGCDHLGSGSCATVDATGLIVAGNREAGIFVSGGALSLSASLVQNTLANASHGLGGIGVQAQCDTTSADCPVLNMVGSVVQGNRAAGVMVLGVDAVFRDTVVRDTQPQQGDQRLGNGIVAQCDPSLAVCEPLAVTCSVVEGNHQTGLTVAGVTAQVEDTIIRDTWAQQSDLRAGHGLLALCDGVTSRCADLTVTRSAVEESHYAALFIHGSAVTLNGAYVADTQPGALADEEGMALMSLCNTTVGECPVLDIDASVFEHHFSEGLSVFGGSGTLQRSRILDIQAQQADGEFGFGLYIDGRTALETPVIDIFASEVTDAFFVGLFWVSAEGSLRNALVRGGQYSVALQSSPDVVLEENELHGTTSSVPLIQ